MRKFQHHITVLGHKGSVKEPMDVPGLNFFRAADCKRLAVTVNFGKSFSDGVRSITLFPDISQVMSKIEPNGLRCDWVRMGEDLQRSMHQWPVDLAEGDANEREPA